MKHEDEDEAARALEMAPPQAYERGADGKRAWWRRALDLFGTFRRKQGDALSREDVAEYRKQKAREELPVTDPERHLGLRVSRLEDMAKGLVVDGDVEFNDLGDNFDLSLPESAARTRWLRQANVLATSVTHMLIAAVQDPLPGLTAPYFWSAGCSP